MEIGGSSSSRLGSGRALHRLSAIHVPTMVVATATSQGTNRISTSRVMTLLKETKTDFLFSDRFENGPFVTLALERGLPRRHLAELVEIARRDLGQLGVGHFLKNPRTAGNLPRVERGDELFTAVP